MPVSTPDRPAQLPLTVKESCEEVPPPGAGLDMSMVAVPAWVRSLAGTKTITCELFRNARGRGERFAPTVHPAEASGEKPDPLISTSVSLLPAAALEGFRDDAVGFGLSGPVIAKLTEGEPTTRLGVNTATLPEPTAAILLAGTDAVSWVAFTNVVASTVPFQVTGSLAAKLLPLMVRVKAAPPALVLAGESEAIAGASGRNGSIVKPTAVEVPPPGAGFTTVTSTEAGEAISEARIWTSSSPVV